MGSKYIWICASIAYGILSGLIYALIARHRRYKGSFWRRFIVWSVIYTVAGLAICRVLWHFLSD
ncbi:MAG: hypothetical protein K2O38_05515 [Muribaculaceae bacterium]|nr:hypothetical protein [Muribaculaceae bacterium]MDE7111341.1 hypothetical protein [Muribaculaceae bacterium]